MKMSNWGNRSEPTLLVPEELKNHQVIKNEVRHFVTPSSQRPMYKRVNSLPNITYNQAQSRWHNSSHESNTANIESAVIRGTQSPRSAQSQPKPKPQSQRSLELKTTKKKKESGHKSREKMSSISAHARLVSDSVENKRSTHKRKGKRVPQNKTMSKSDHDSLRRKNLLRDDNDGVSSNTLLGRNHEYNKNGANVVSSGLFEGDSFVGTMPLGGMDDSERNGGELVMTTSGSSSSADPYSSDVVCSDGRHHGKQEPVKNTMRRRRKDPSNTYSSGIGCEEPKDSSGSSLSSASAMAQDQPDESPSTAMAKESSGSTLNSPIPNPSIAPSSSLMKKNNDRWSSSVVVKCQPSPTDSPRRPGRVSSEASISLAAACAPPLTDDMENDIPSLNHNDMKDSASSSKDTGAVHRHTKKKVIASPCSGSSKHMTHDTALVAHTQIKKRNVRAPTTEQREEEVVGVEALKTDKGDKKPRRRGSTGVMAQKWEEQFPCKTPILPASAPSTPVNHARHGFNGRRRGSFGIFSDLSHDDEERARAPKFSPESDNVDVDEYELFLQSGATGDFATWVERYRRDKCVTPSTSPSIHRKNFRPPAKRRGSTGALAEKWEQELLPSLQSTAHPVTPPSIAPCIGSMFIQEKQRLLEEWTKREKSPKSTNVDLHAINADDKLSPPLCESKRRGSMGALLEKWEILTSPASSPKETLRKTTECTLLIDSDVNKQERSRKVEVPIANGQKVRANVVKHFPGKSPRQGNVGPILNKEGDSPLGQQKRRCSTGVLETKIRKHQHEKKEKEGNKSSSSISGKKHIRVASLGNLEHVSLEKEKRKKSHREKDTLKSSKKKTVTTESQQAVGTLSLPQPSSCEQLAGEASTEKSLKKFPISLTTEGDISVPNPNKIKKKLPKNTDHSLQSADSHSTMTALTLSSEKDNSKRRSCSHSLRTGRTVSDIEASNCSNENPHLKKTKSTVTSNDSSKNGNPKKHKLKKRSNSVGPLKIRVKKSNSDAHRSRSDSLVIAAADSEKIKKQKRSQSQGLLCERGPTKIVS